MKVSPQLTLGGQETAQASWGPSPLGSVPAQTGPSLGVAGAQRTLPLSGEGLGQSPGLRHLQTAQVPRAGRMRPSGSPQARGMGQFPILEPVHHPCSEEASHGQSTFRMASPFDLLPHLGGSTAIQGHAARNWKT